MPKMIALSPVNHDGVDYTEGDEFEVKEKGQAEALVAVKAALVKGSKAAKAEGDEKPAEA